MKRNEHFELEVPYEDDFKAWEIVLATFVSIIICTAMNIFIGML